MSVTVDRMPSRSIFLGLNAAVEEEEENECSPSLSSSSTISSASSIGKDSDVTDGEDCEDDDNEVQSSYNVTTSFDSMEALEEVLPIRRGISKFYNGKSKSFTSLAEASSSSCLKDIAKPENAYTRKRRNLLANHLWDKKGSFSRGWSSSGMISKRPISASKSTLALAVAMSSSESISSSDDSNSSSYSKSPPQLPPLHPRSTASHCNLASLSSPSSSRNNLALLPSRRPEFPPSPY